ncbi:MAG: RHS repeat-associated core domain-containing protein [Bryobacteraceae bacterium]
MLTDPTGAVTDTYDYDAWGNIVSLTGSTSNLYLYRGEQYDPDLNLYYLRARYFNPLTGRFLTRDLEAGLKVSPKSLHKYLYAEGDPINGSDPTGRQELVEYALPTATIAVGEAVFAFAVAAELDCIAIREMTGFGALPSGQNNYPPWCKSDSCQAKYPNYIPAYELFNYPFQSESEAFMALQAAYLPRPLRKTTQAPAFSGPCGNGSGYVPGWHINVLVQGGGYAGSLVGCPCCDDSTGGAQLTQRWGIQ